MKQRNIIARFAAPIGMLLVAGGVSACGEEFATEDEAIGTVIEFEPNRPDLGDSREIAPYEGTNSFVLEAQSRYRTGLDLHVGIISRTCSPTGGVCHNQKEYPDLHTPSNFVSSIDAPWPSEKTSAICRWSRSRSYRDVFSPVR